MKAIRTLEWIFGISALLTILGTSVWFGFDRSAFLTENMTPLQQWALQIYGPYCIAIAAVMVGVIILNFLVNDFPWGHIMGCLGMISFAYFYVIFSVYFLRLG